MALYELTSDGIQKVPSNTLEAAGVREREDLQRVLRENIEVVAPGTLIISEEFSEWRDSRRRIDLLGVDRQGNLVVFELKRTQDGGHMDLQAIRYAAMVSTLTFDRIVDVFEDHLKKSDSDENAEERLLSHLGWDSPTDETIAAQVRIVLISADFGQEITTAVLWLNEQGLDIRCVRLSPYQHGDEILLDIQQIIPLPEASDYMVRVREKAEEQKSSRRQQDRDFTKYTVSCRGESYTNLPKRQAIFQVVKFLVGQGISPEEVDEVLPGNPTNRIISIEGVHDEDEFVARVIESRQKEGRVFDPGRYFTNDSELIHFGGSTYTMTKMWGAQTEESMKTLIEANPGCDIAFEAEE